MKIKVEFSISTNRVGSEEKGVVELEFLNNENEEQIEEAIQDSYLEWLGEHNRGGYHILD